VAVISMIPDLHQDVVSALSSVPTPSKEQAPEVRAAIGAMLLRLRTPEAADRGSAGYAMHLLTSFLGRVGDGSDLALLGEVAKASADGLASHIASIMLELAGAKRTTVLAEMLDSKSLRYVQVALQAEELRTDAGLRQRALQATLLLGRQLDGSPLDRLTSADALAMAKEIAAHPDFAEFHPTLAHSALGVLGDARDDALIGLILRGAKHRTSHVRGRVVSELGNNFSDAAARALLELMRDSDDAVRKAAKERLDQIGEYLDARAKWDARKK
jgi:HEAT repeat protein